MQHCGHSDTQENLRISRVINRAIFLLLFLSQKKGHKRRRPRESTAARAAPTPRHHSQDLSPGQAQIITPVTHSAAVNVSETALRPLGCVPPAPHPRARPPGNNPEREKSDSDDIGDGDVTVVPGPAAGRGPWPAAPRARAAAAA